MSWEDILKKQFNFGMLDFKRTSFDGSDTLVLDARYSAKELLNLKFSRRENKPYPSQIYDFRLLKYPSGPDLILVQNPDDVTIYDKTFSSDNLLEDLPNDIIREVEEAVRKDIKERNMDDFPRTFQDMNKSVMQ